MNLLDLSQIPMSDVKIGDRGTVWFGHCGQGGVVTAIEPAEHTGTVRVVTVTGPAGNEVRIPNPSFFIPESAEEENEAFRVKGFDDGANGNDHCDDFPNEACELAYSIGWSAGTRCRLVEDRNSVARYADSDVVPEWFDPSIAGEHWDEDY